MIYISGPISNTDPAKVAANLAEFHRVADELRAAGLMVANPAENGLPADAPWADHMRADIRMMMQCDGVVTLDGWSHSKGARLEVHIARALGMRVWPLWQWLAWAALKQFSEKMGDVARMWGRG